MDIKSGKKTGANDFFYIKGENVIEFGLNEYMRPILKGTGQVESVIFDKKDTDWFVLDIHHLVSPILKNLEKRTLGEDLSGKNEDGESNLAKRVRVELRKKHKKLSKYIDTYGYLKEVYKVQSVKSRKIWFDLGELEISPYIFPAEYWRNTFIIYNKDEITIDKRFYFMNPNFENENLSKEESMLLIGGILNSDIIPLMRELTGRTASGQAMNRNECMIYETKSIKIPDPRLISKDNAKEIIKNFQELMDFQDNKDEDSENTRREIRHSLNNSVLRSISLHSKTNELEESVKELLNIRENGRGLNKKIPFSYSGKKIGPKIKGARVLKQRKIDSF